MKQEGFQFSRACPKILSNYSNQIWPLAEPATALGGPALHPSASVAFGWAAAHHPLWPEKWQNHQPHRYLGTSWYIPHSNASPFHIFSRVNPPGFSVNPAASSFRFTTEILALTISRTWTSAQKVRGFLQSFPSWEVVKWWWLLYAALIKQHLS